MPKKINLKIAVKFFLILSFLAQASCGSLSLKNDVAKENNFRFKKQEMDDALSMCWDATVRKIGGDNQSNKEIEKWQQTQSTSKEFWRSYNQKKTNSKEVWNDYSQRFFTTFWRNEFDKYFTYTLAIFSFGIALIPTDIKDYNYNYREFDHPPYSHLIEYCEFKFENYKKSYGELDEPERKIVGSPEWIEDRNKKFLEERKREEDERERLEVIELRKAKIERQKQDLETEKRNNYAKSLGYNAGISEGIIATIRKITSGKLSFGESGQYLIKKSPNDTFKVGNIIENYVIFQAFRNYDLVQIAVIKTPGEVHINGSILKGKYFAVVGMQQFTKVFGGNAEVLVLRKIE